MEKSQTEVTTRTFSKNGKRYEETVEKVTTVDAQGNVKTNTTTTTKEVDVFSTRELNRALPDAKSKTTRKDSHSSSYSSESDDESDRRKKTNQKKEGSRSGGLLNKLRGSAGKTSDDDGYSSDEEEFIKDMHKRVNEVRVKHGVAKLKLSKEMNKYAREWARKLASDDKMSNRPDRKFGENIFCLSSNVSNVKVKAEEVVDKWYGEVKDHTFGQEPRGTMLKTGHFTQMVWKDSKQFGVGRARNKDGNKVYVVANFDPPGNFMGSFAENVPPVGGFSKKTTSSKPGLISSVRKSSSSDSDGEEDFAKETLKVHNDLRRKHDVPDLKLSKKLCKVSEDWARTLAKRDVMQHRPNSEYGENIYCGWSSNPSFRVKPKEAVEDWYSEIKYYSFGREPNNLKAGHFSQVVWRDSKELGVGSARSSSGKVYVVANYEPAGNVVSRYTANVPKPK